MKTFAPETHASCRSQPYSALAHLAFLDCEAGNSTSVIANYHLLSARLLARKKLQCSSAHRRNLQVIYPSLVELHLELELVQTNHPPLDVSLEVVGFI